MLLVQTDATNRLGRDVIAETRDHRLALRDGGCAAIIFPINPNMCCAPVCDLSRAAGSAQPPTPAIMAKVNSRRPSAISFLRGITVMRILHGPSRGPELRRPS